MKITVIICTYNRFKLLKTAIKSLLNQTYNKEEYEIIIVDNASIDETKKVVLEFINKFEQYNIRYFFEPKLGLSHARNAGFKNAKSDFVAYIDDDAKANSDFVEKAISYIQKGYNIFGGKYIAYYEEEKPHWYKGSYGSCSYGDKYKLLEPGKYLNGTNMVFKKQLLYNVGGFNPKVGMNGQNLSYGEETQLQIKLCNIGYDIHYMPDLIVHHLVPGYKMNVRWFIFSSFKNGISHHITFNTNSTSITKNIISLLFDFIKSIRCFLIKLLRKNHYKTVLIDCLSPLSYSLGITYDLINHKMRP